jgi:hypothetical protein
MTSPSRNLGKEGRTKFRRRLIYAACRAFGYLRFAQARDAWVLKRHKTKQKLQQTSWASTRVRPEIVAVANILCEFHLSNTGKELSQAEAINAIAAAGLEVLLRQPEFNGSSANIKSKI